MCEYGSSSVSLGYSTADGVFQPSCPEAYLFFALFAGTYNILYLSEPGKLKGKRLITYSRLSSKKDYRAAYHSTAKYPVEFWNASLMRFFRQPQYYQGVPVSFFPCGEKLSPVKMREQLFPHGRYSIPYRRGICRSIWPIRLRNSAYEYCFSFCHTLSAVLSLRFLPYII